MRCAERAIVIDFLLLYFLPSLRACGMTICVMRSRGIMKNPVQLQSININDTTHSGD